MRTKCSTTGARRRCGKTFVAFLLLRFLFVFKATAMRITKGLANEYDAEAKVAAEHSPLYNRFFEEP
jgi:cell division protein FtsB